MYDPKPGQRTRQIEDSFVEDFKVWLANAKLPDGTYNETDAVLATWKKWFIG